MSKRETKLKVHPVSIPGKNAVGTKRFWLLSDAAERAAEAFNQGFYLEAITLAESLLGTRLESRLTWVKQCQGKCEATKFSTLGRLCNELLQKDANVAPDWAAFQVPIHAIRKWATQRNEALHEMAKLVDENDHEFSIKYARCRATALDGIQALLAYDAVDREERRKAGKSTATDNGNGGTAFDSLREIG